MDLDKLILNELRSKIRGPVYYQVFCKNCIPALNNAYRCLIQLSDAHIFPDCAQARCIPTFLRILRAAAETPPRPTDASLRARVREVRVKIVANGMRLADNRSTSRASVPLRANGPSFATVSNVVAHLWTPEQRTDP